MADDKEVKSWIAGQLHGLLGFSEGHVASYILTVAKKHSSADSLAVVLRQQGLPASAETNAFASQLLSKLPRKGSAGTQPTYATQTRQVRELIKKNQTYGLLDDDEPEQPVAKPMPAPPSKPASKAKEHGVKERQIRSKREASVEEREQDGGAVLPQGKKQRRAWEEDEEEEEGPAEREERRAREERERDKREKEEFEERLRARDETRTKKLAPEEKLSKAEQREQEKRKWGMQQGKAGEGLWGTCTRMRAHACTKAPCCRSAWRACTNVAAVHACHLALQQQESRVQDQATLLLCPMPHTPCPMPCAPCRMPPAPHAAVPHAPRPLDSSFIPHASFSCPMSSA